jgi:hypothetical protein
LSGSVRKSTLLCFAAGTFISAPTNIDAALLRENENLEA